MLHGIPIPERNREGKVQPVALTFERHFTPKELAALWALDETTIRRIFYDEPGVLKTGKAQRRIPNACAARTGIARLLTCIG